MDADQTSEIRSQSTLTELIVADDAPAPQSSPVSPVPQMKEVRVLFLKNIPPSSVSFQFHTIYYTLFLSSYACTHVYITLSVCSFSSFFLAEEVIMVFILMS